MFNYTSYEFVDPVAVFRAAVRPLAETLTQQLGHAPEYVALFMPAVFTPEDREAARQAVGMTWEDVHIGAARHAVGYAYGFHEGRNLGRTEEEWVRGEVEDLVLVLEYEREYVYMWLLEYRFGVETQGVVQEDMDTSCGERVVVVSWLDGVGWDG